MRNLKYYLLTLLMVLGFVTGTVLTVHAEPEDDYDLLISLLEDSSEVSNTNTESSYAQESSQFVESSADESSEEHSFDTSEERPTVSDGDAESSVSVSEPESSAESTIDSSGPQSDTESSDEPSDLVSYDGSSQDESSASPSESRTSDESSRSSEDSQEISSAQSSGEISPEPSDPSASESDVTESSVLTIGLKQNPLQFLALIRNVIPANRAPEADSDLSPSCVRPIYDHLSDNEIPYTDIEGAILTPVTETPPDAAAVSPPKDDSRRTFLIGIVIFALIGMMLTVALILIMRSRGDFVPSVFRPKPKKRSKYAAKK